MKDGKLSVLQTLIIGAVLMILLSMIVCAVRADTVNLKNGYTIYGDVTHPDETKVFIPKDYVRVGFKNGGWMLILDRHIANVTENDKDHFEEYHRRNKKDDSRSTTTSQETQTIR